MTGKWLKLQNALLLATAFFLAAHLTYKLTFLFFENPVTRNVAAPSDLLPVAGNDKRLSEYQPIKARTPANAGQSITAMPDTIDTARYAGETTLNVIEILIAEGANVQAKNIYNNTALMNAVRSGQTDVVELLVREGADINARARNGQTALKLAADSLRKDVVAVLTDYGAMLQ